MKLSRTLVFLAFLASSCASTEAVSQGTTSTPAEEPAIDVVLTSEVTWEHLNPARGDNSPQAGTLWGDRNGTVPTGFLAKFTDGFSSPPHIHNVTYRAVVISGFIHNDDPGAAEMWMTAGSFWTQPKGEVHITAARGVNNVALVEIDKGPYLVLPTDQAFDSGERPINVDHSNLVWVDPPGTMGSGYGAAVAYLWGGQREGEPSGAFVKLPAGFVGNIHSRGSVFRAVVIKGSPKYRGSKLAVLTPGSYFGSKGEVVHRLSSDGGEEIILYIRTDGIYHVAGSRE